MLIGIFSNAYVSGMKEDLNLYGDELNYFTTAFNVSYAVMLIPSQVIMTWVRPSFWLPALEVAWGVMTGLMAMVTTAKQVYIIREFLGAFESSAWPGMMTLFMHWVGVSCRS
jgi:sugar phosphate permease